MHFQCIVVESIFPLTRPQPRVHTDVRVLTWGIRLTRLLNNQKVYYFNRSSFTVRLICIKIICNSVRYA